MRVGELIEQRRQNWARLDFLCSELEKFGSRRKDPNLMLEFASLYRSACSDLAMADSYQLPATTVEFLHRLVGRSHIQMYKGRSFDIRRLVRVITEDTPRAIFGDYCVHICSFIFFGLFLMSAVCAYWETRFPGFCETIIGVEQLEQFDEMYDRPLNENFEHYILMSAFYIQHNTSIGLNCFGTGPLIIWPLCTLGYNAVVLGAVFGYMARPDNPGGENFFQFVTAHGPFELSAIALSAAAGLRIGIGVIATAGLRRFDSFRIHGMRSLPIIGCSVVLFILAAFTEGFISPSPLPYPFKVFWAAGTSSLMMLYFVVLGFPRGRKNAA